MFLLQWEWVMGNDGCKVVDLFDRERSEKHSNWEPANLGDIQGRLWPHRLELHDFLLSLLCSPCFSLFFFSLFLPFLFPFSFGKPDSKCSQFGNY